MNHNYRHHGIMILIQDQAKAKIQNIKKEKANLLGLPKA